MVKLLFFRMPWRACEVQIAGLHPLSFSSEAKELVFPTRARMVLMLGPPFENLQSCLSTRCFVSSTFFLLSFISSAVYPSVSALTNSGHWSNVFIFWRRKP